MSARTRRLLLWCAATDRTFSRVEIDGRRFLGGKCIHCNRQVLMGLDGDGLGRASLEHIVPRTHGGTEAPENLAVACPRCNHQKGYRLDVRRADDPTALRVIETLRARRAARLREPPEWLDLPDRPDSAADSDDSAP